MFDLDPIKIDLTKPEDLGNVAEQLAGIKRNKSGDVTEGGDLGVLRSLAEDIIRLVKTDEDSMSEFLSQAEAAMESTAHERNTSASSADDEQRGSGEKQPPSTGLISTAVAQTSAHTVGQLFSTPDIARASNSGGEALAKWVSDQVRAVDPMWAQDTDDLMGHATLTGLAWRKRSFSTITGGFESEWLTGTSVIVNAKTKRLDKTPRVAHRDWQYPNDIMRKIATGHWVDFEPNFDDDEMAGQEAQETLEVDMSLDLDGDDIGEPYMVTVAGVGKTPCVVKIEPRWTKKTVVMIDGDPVFRPFLRYTPYRTRQSLDGKFFTPGYYSLLVNDESAINRLYAAIIDAAESASENGGVAFGGAALPSKIELKGNRITTIPGADGRNINEVLQMFPVRQVSPAAVQALQYMMTVADRKSGGLNAAENSPASMTATLANALTQTGAASQSAVYRRVLNAVTAELKAFAYMAWALDKLPEGVDPASVFELTADPNMATQQDRNRQIAVMAQLMANPHANQQEALKRFLELSYTRNPEALIAPPPQGPAPMPPELQIKMQEIQNKHEIAKAQLQVSMVEALAAAYLDVARAGAVRTDTQQQLLGLMQTAGQMGLLPPTQAPGGPQVPPPMGGPGGAPMLMPPAQPQAFQFPAPQAA
ncbi:hypothetical protein [Bradyrhizobium manausense]|uniref:Portal protein n=1 Tax=Bradyrhizobium manausense TaxID=989370 RepID=A0A0R3D7G1_9BRAD|nr:hypothetical protein [Bradyrhizobium manausense]KRQ03285.1 hypothetical protein AOQ71_31655 [Bradyrhizobium manausense]